MRLLLLLISLLNLLSADVLKPALVEITFLKNQTLEIVFEANLEAIISEISTNYKNTTNAPNSEEYDVLRKLEPKELLKKFNLVELIFLNNISLLINNKKIALKRKSIDIDIVGYTKRARKSVIIYSASLKETPKILHWRYNKVYGDNALRYRFYQKDKYTWGNWNWLRGDESSGEIKLDYNKYISKFDIFSKFISIGFWHVIPLGLDHILFIISMSMSIIPWKHLLLLVTSFTIAHTITLGFSMIGIIDLPPSIVEPLIALSIVYVAIENLISNQSIKRKSIIVFLFGLLHGLGFASMLKTLQMSKDNFLSTLIGFNIGVELAQIIIVLNVLFVLFLLRKYTSFYKIFVVLVSIVIGLIALYWSVDRVEF